MKRPKARVPGAAQVIMRVAVIQVMLVMFLTLMLVATVVMMVALVTVGVGTAAVALGWQATAGVTNNRSYEGVIEWDHYDGRQPDGFFLRGEADFKAVDAAFKVPRIRNFRL